ncbi:pentapeptide repeat-containing protein [Parvularcula bermudensis]|nr:pentapeptide repeat-containing protein [Parvularcula bermudensis]
MRGTRSTPRGLRRLTWRVGRWLGRERLRTLNQGRTVLRRPWRDWRAFLKGMDVLEGAFYRLFLIVFVTVVFSLGWLSVTGHLPVFDGLIPSGYGGRNGWEEFRSLMFGLAGLAGAIFGLYQLGNASTRTRLTRLDTDTKREAVRNERFVSAAQLLAHGDGAVRMAGIYPLERLATEDGHVYFQTVIDVLAGFVRERTNRPDYPPRLAAGEEPELEAASPDASWADRRALEARNAEKRRDWYGQWAPPTEPMATALTALSRLTKNAHGRAVALPRVNLTAARLPHWRASEVFAREWEWREAVLVESDLQSADVRGANLSKANLSKANLSKADLSRANLIDADLSKADLSKADLVGARLIWANLSGADLAEANLSETRLTDAKGLTAHILNRSLWPTARPPKGAVSQSAIIEELDKTWCTDPEDPTRLHPIGKQGAPPPLPEK